ncbi:hypothetical protein D3C73_1443650 [compost metagenome]
MDDAGTHRARGRHAALFVPLTASIRPVHLNSSPWSLPRATVVMPEGNVAHHNVALRGKRETPGG